MTEPMLFGNSPPRKIVSFQDVAVGYAADQAFLNVVSFELEQGDRWGLVGRSGAGKSTMLRTILEGSVWHSGAINVNRQELVSRGVGLVGQDQTLIPWKTARMHVAWAARIHRHANAAAQLDEVLARVGLSGANAEKFPDSLSGGMRRRLMLAMALASRPALLVLDEAFGSVDYFTKNELIRAVDDYCRESGAGLVIVSHDIREIVALSQRVACINQAGMLISTDFVSQAMGAPFASDLVSHEADRLFHVLDPLIGNET